MNCSRCAIRVLRTWRYCQACGHATSIPSWAVGLGVSLGAQTLLEQVWAECRTRLGAPRTARRVTGGKGAPETRTGVLAPLAPLGRPFRALLAEGATDRAPDASKGDEAWDALNIWLDTGTGGDHPEEY